MAEKPTYEELEKRVRFLEERTSAHVDPLEKCHETEDIYRDIFQRNNAIKLLINPDSGDILDANAAACKFYQYPLEQIKTLKIWNINALGKSRTKAQMALAISGEQTDFIFQHKLASGEIRDVQVCSGTLQTGKQKLLHSIIIDITEQKRAEKEAKRYSENLKAIFDSSPNILVLLNDEVRVEMINHKGTALVGKDNEELSGNLCGDVFSCMNACFGEGCGENAACSRCPLRSRILSTFKTGIPHTEEEGQMTFLINGNETSMDLLISTTLMDADGTHKVLLSLTDITEIKNVEEKLSESETMHKELFDNSPTPLYIQDFSRAENRIKEIQKENRLTDLKTYLQNNTDEVLSLASMVKILQSNKAAKKMYQFNSAEDSPDRFSIVLKPDDMDHFIDQLVDFTEGKDWFEAEARNVDSKGNVLNILLKKVVMNRRKNGLSKILTAVTDVTEVHKFHREKAELEIQLQQAQKMESLGNLAGGIAHDFNNILFPIIGMSELLLDDLPPHSREYQNTQIILNAGKRGAELVKQILAFSRQSKRRLMPVRAQQVLNEVLKLIRATIPSYIEIEKHIQTDCGLIMADATQIHQVTMNIITNAFHAVESEGGKIAVQLKEVTLEAGELADSSLGPGRYVLLSVTDTGHGISPEIIHMIFEPYFTTKGQGKGTGLGLAAAYGIIKEHKGDIKVFSEVGKGTTFEIYLPLMEKIAGIETFDDRKSYPEGNERILLVDDDESIVDLEKQMLERLGYHVTERTSSPDALKAFKANPAAFDLVVSDMTMPNMTGDQLLKELTAIRPDIPVIICTGFSARIDQETPEKSGAKGFLMKPVTMAAMAKMVRKVLDEAREP